jgi:hypothetical protein
MYRDKLRDIILNGLFRDRVSMTNSGFKGVQDDLLEEKPSSFFNNNEPTGFIVHSNNNERYLVTIQQL